MKYALPLLLLIFTACSTSTNPGESKSASENDSTEIEDNATSSKPESPTEGAALFAHLAGYFPTSNELYVSLNFKKDIEVNRERLAMSHDSLIYSNEEYTRVRVEKSLSERYFDLDRLNTLEVFNLTGETMGEASLVRVEYMEDMLFSQYIAVLKPSKSAFSENESYVVINPVGREIKKGWSFEKFESISFSNSVISQAGIKASYIMAKSHLEIQPDNTTYSSISVTTEEFKRTSYLMKSYDSTTEVIMEFSEDYIIDQLFGTPLVLNGRPVLLLQLGIPDTDVTWYLPAYFDGENYVIAEDNAFRLQ